MRILGEQSLQRPSLVLVKLVCVNEGILSVCLAARCDKYVASTYRWSMPSTAARGSRVVQLWAASMSTCQLSFI